MGLTVEQYFKAIAIIPKPASVLSISGSLYIIFHVWRDARKRSKCQFRLLAGLASVDVLTSCATFLSSWPMPVDEAGPVWGAAGTDLTCTIHGWFMQFSTAAHAYNSSLALYYLLAVRYGWKEERFAKLEPYMHLIPIIWGITTSTVGVFLDGYHNATLWCWWAPPFEYYNEFRLGCFYSVVWFTCFFSIYSMFMIFWTVWRQEKANTRYMQQGEAGRSFRKTKMVATQGFFYCFMFLATWVVPSAFRVQQHREAPTNYVLMVWMAYFVSAQGFANFLVFIRPRVARYVSLSESSSTTQQSSSGGGGGAQNRTNSEDSTNNNTRSSRSSNSTTKAGFFARIFSSSAFQSGSSSGLGTSNRKTKSGMISSVLSNSQNGGPAGAGGGMGEEDGTSRTAFNRDDDDHDDGGGAPHAARSSNHHAQKQPQQHKQERATPTSGAGNDNKELTFFGEIVDEGTQIASSEDIERNDGAASNNSTTSSTTSTRMTLMMGDIMDHPHHQTIVGREMHQANPQESQHQQQDLYHDEP